MCRYTYHHYPSCGHIASWSVDSCIEFTNSLRGIPSGQLLSCRKAEKTHDLLPVSYPALCFQCERDWQDWVKHKGFSANSDKKNVFIEGLGTSGLVVEVQCAFSLGVQADELADLKSDHHANQPGDECRKPSLISFPPPRLAGIPRSYSLRRNHKCSAPIATNAYKTKLSNFDQQSPVFYTTQSIRSASGPSLSCYTAPRPAKAQVSDNWSSYPTPTSLIIPSPLSFNYSPTSMYSADMKDVPLSDSTSVSPMLPSVPRPEEYALFGVTPEDAHDVRAFETQELQFKSFGMEFM